MKARLTNEEWILVEKIKSILQPFAGQTTVLQSEQLSLSDLYGVWAKLIMELKKFRGDQLTNQLLYDGAGMYMNSNIFNYWEQQKTSKPELYTLASVVRSVSPSQTSVERGFSAFALVLSFNTFKIGFGR